MNDLPISESNWERLVKLNKQTDWTAKEVFGTGIGPGYMKGGLLYVGKSAGPLGSEVGSVDDQKASCLASKNWMVERRNQRSPFWQFIEKIDPTRQQIAWTNVCKMDKVGGDRAPQGGQWKQIAEACVAALTDEIHFLEPKIIVFATSGLYAADVRPVLVKLGFRSEPLDFDDGFTSLFTTEDGRLVIQTRHPQGWNRNDRDRVISRIESLM